jgi:hypothetical protein
VTAGDRFFGLFSLSQSTVKLVNFREMVNPWRAQTLPAVQTFFWPLLAAIVRFFDLWRQELATLKAPFGRQRALILDAHLCHKLFSSKVFAAI